MQSATGPEKLCDNDVTGFKTEHSVRGNVTLEKMTILNRVSRNAG